MKDILVELKFLKRKLGVHTTVSPDDLIMLISLLTEALKEVELRYNNEKHWFDFLKRGR